MIRFFSLALLMTGFSVMVLTAQGKYTVGFDGGEASAAGLIVPINVLLQNAKSGRITWQPDWPPNIPVDAFNILNDDWARNVAAITLVNGYINLTARRDERGLLIEFPIFLDGVFYQVNTYFDSRGRINGFIMNGKRTVEIEFLAFENAGGEPSLARIRSGDSWFFAAITYQNGLALETWYDVVGKPLAVFSTRLENGRPVFYKYVLKDTGNGADNYQRGAYGPGPDGIRTAAGPKTDSDIKEAVVINVKLLYFDNMGNTTQVDSVEGVFEAVYASGKLYYWKYPGSNNLALQWDVRGFLVRMAGFTANDVALDYRYEYTVDNRGVWVERRQFLMNQELGVLIPVAGSSFKRFVEYR
ncbi:MAG: hypothetical protein LBC27_07875 [Spirochaetaceae bacterium]|jgi:hypothetical protein|nr:hypothetical protein [Spirochaetaceae bacterium]